MKEALEELIKTYELRIKVLGDMVLESHTDIARARFVIKVGVYRSVLADLKRLLRDEQDKT